MDEQLTLKKLQQKLTQLELLAGKEMSQITEELKKLRARLTDNLLEGDEMLLIQVVNELESIERFLKTQKSCMLSLLDFKYGENSNEWNVRRQKWDTLGREKIGYQMWRELVEITGDCARSDTDERTFRKHVNQYIDTVKLYVDKKYPGFFQGWYQAVIEESEKRTGEEYFDSYVRRLNSILQQLQSSVM